MSAALTWSYLVATFPLAGVELVFMSHDDEALCWVHADRSKCDVVDAVDVTLLGTNSVASSNRTASGSNRSGGDD
jgi:hypothetical protein